LLNSRIGFKVEAMEGDTMQQIDAVIRDYTEPEIESHLNWMREQMKSRNSVEMVWVFGSVTVSVNRTSNNRLNWAVRMPGDTHIPLALSAIPAFVVANQH
jgi:hypothetical protein